METWRAWQTIEVEREDAERRLARDRPRQAAGHGEVGRAAFARLRAPLVRVRRWAMSGGPVRGTGLGVGTP
jgi:hypothetical protein